MFRQTVDLCDYDHDREKKSNIAWKLKEDMDVYWNETLIDDKRND
jgi:hypothetical protein